MIKKRFTIIGDENIEFIMQTQLLLPIYDNDKRLSLKSCCDLLNNQHEENELLKKEYCEMEIKVGKLKGEIGELFCENEHLKHFISKIDSAIIRKYDNSLENLLDEIYDGEYENWIKKQVSRAKKLDGDGRNE